MIVSWDISACITNVSLDVMLMKIAAEVNLVPITNVSIHVLRILVVQMLYVQYQIKEQVVHAQVVWYQVPLPRLVVLDHLLYHAQKIEIVLKDLLA